MVRVKLEDSGSDSETDLNHNDKSSSSTGKIDDNMLGLMNLEYLLFDSFLGTGFLRPSFANYELEGHILNPGF